MKALKIFSRDLFFFIAVFGFCLVGFYYAFAYTEAPPGTPPACPAGYPGCDAPINVGTTPQIKKGNLNVGDGSWLSITPYLNATYFGGYGAQKINARASAFSAVAGANPGKSFSLIMLAWNGTTNNLDTFCQNLINSSWHAQVVVKGNYFNQSFNNSDFWSYSTAITSQAEFDTYRSTGTQWWVGCSVLPAWSKNVGGYWQDGGSGKIYYNSGNVGIGTTAPGAKLELRGANIINTDALRISNASGNVVTGNVIGDIQFYGNDASRWGIGKVAEIQAVAFNDWTGGGRHTDLTFLTNSGGDVNPTEKVRITNAGNVGIGTVSPSYKLDVSGNGRFTQPVIIGTPTANTGSQAVNVDYLNTRLSGGTGGTVNAHECTADGTCETKNIAATGNLTVSGSAQAAKFDGAYTPRYQTWASQSTGAGGAAIYNDNGSYDALMVVGNDQGLGYNRWVRVWDSLWVNTRMDAPIYYDSSNTGYYVDPASTSNLNAANFAGNVGIGAPAPSAGLKLDVEGKVGATNYCDQNGNNCYSSAESIVVDVEGSTNNFYPVFFDRKNSYGASVAEFLLSRTSVHDNASWKGSFHGEFKFGLYNWGHTGSFFDYNIRGNRGSNAFVANPRVQCSGSALVLYLRGASRYYFYNIRDVAEPTIYLSGTSRSECGSTINYSVLSEGSVTTIYGASVNNAGGNYVIGGGTVYMGNLTASGGGSFVQPITVGSPTVNTGSQAVNVDYLNIRLGGGGGGTITADNSKACNADDTCETTSILNSGGTINNPNSSYRWVGGSNWNTFHTPSGYIQFGPANANWAHIYSDGKPFIFNTSVYSVANTFSSYNNNLLLQRAGTTMLTLTSSGATISGIGTADRLISTGRADVGNINSDYLPNGTNWQYNLLLNAKDNSSIGFHDSGASVSSIRYSNSGFTIGANDGWGVKSVSFPGGVCLGGTCKTDWSQVTGGIVEEADPTVPEAVKAITDIEIGNWSAVFDRVAGSGDDWDTAFGWGDHDSQNYLKEGSIVNELTINKLNVTTIDPVYEIDGEKYATYVADFAGGVRIETSGVLQALDKKEIDFKDLEKGGDLWLFWQASNKSVNDLVVILTPGFNGKAWYEKQDNKIIIFSDQKGEVSYRLSLPRKDASEWPNKIEK